MKLRQKKKKQVHSVRPRLSVQSNYDRKARAMETSPPSPILNQPICLAMTAASTQTNRTRITFWFGWISKGGESNVEKHEIIMR